MSEWKALVGRITLFPAPSSQPLPSALDLYTKLWADEPSSFQRATNPLAPSMAQGTFAGMAVACTAHPSRIDFTLTPIASGESPETPTFFVIEDSEALGDELLRLAKVVEENLLANPILRVATFLQFVALEADSTAANGALMAIVPKHLRVKLDDEEEFILQINHPRMSRSLEGTKFNLITKWSVDRFQIMSVLVPMGTTPMYAPQSGVSPQVSEFIAASVTFDNNNVPVPASTPLSSKQQASFLIEGLRYSATSILEGALKIKGFDNEKFAH